MLYRQRITDVDDFLLRAVFPFLESTGLISILRLPRIWNEPIVLAGTRNKNERSKA